MTADQITDREAWLAERRKGCGGSDAGAIMGLCPWKTRLEVYLDKRGELPPKEATGPMKWGLRLERAIGEAYTEETGRELTSPQKLVWHPGAPWMFATVDFLAPDRPVEVKRVNAFAAKDFGASGSSDVPEHYRLQCLQQMACTDAPICDLAALIGHSDFRIFTIKRDQRQIDKLIEAERDFMDRVKRGDPPLPDFAHPSTLDLLKLLEVGEGSTCDLGEDALAMVAGYIEAREHAKAAEKRQEEIKARLIHLMDGAEMAWLPDGSRISRKLIDRAGYSVAPCSYNDFRLLKAAGAKPRSKPMVVLPTATSGSIDFVPALPIVEKPADQDAPPIVIQGSSSAPRKGGFVRKQRPKMKLNLEVKNGD